MEHSQSANIYWYSIQSICTINKKHTGSVNSTHTDAFWDSEIFSITWEKEKSTVRVQSTAKLFCTNIKKHQEPSLLSSSWWEEFMKYSGLRGRWKDSESGPEGASGKERIHNVLLYRLKYFWVFGIKWHFVWIFQGLRNRASSMSGDDFLLINNGIMMNH